MTLRSVASALVSASAILVFGLSGFAQAQPGDEPAMRPSTDAEELPVMSRPRPEYDAKGLPLGGFRLFPTLALGGTFDDNIFRTELGAVDDVIFYITPAMRLQSQWGRHMLELYAGMNMLKYANNDAENADDWNAGGATRLDLSDGITVYGAGQAAYLHEPRSSPNVSGFQATSTRYFLYHGEGNVTFQPNRLGVQLGGQIDSYLYQNTPLIGGGAMANGDRNYDEYQGFARVSYEFSPGYSGFIRGTYNSRQFDLFLDRSGLHRSSTGYRIDGGVNLEISRLLAGEIYLGYLNQDFAAPLTNVSGLNYGVRLDWFATPLLTVHLNGQRNLSQVILAGASVSDDKSISLSADYEVLRNVLLQAHATYVDSDYVGIARHDTAPSFGVSATYLANSYLSATLGYTFTRRSSNTVGASFDDNAIAFGVNLHL